MSTPKKKAAKKKPAASPVALRVSAFMSKAPKTIGRDQTVAFATRVMKEHRIRHLPVLRGGKLVGVVSSRDLLLMEAMGGDMDQLTVGEAVATDAFSVSPNAAMEDVAREMARKKYGCVVVMRGREVVGILTTTDLARAFADTLRLFKRGAGARPS